ncbi:MAG: excinuclease ABC subunit UvrC [Chloroflexota bacterium]
MTSRFVRKKLSIAPQSPGVYLFRDAHGDVVYVGKAANLRNRVRSYFGSRTGLATKTVRLVSLVEDIEFILAGSEQEALMLEADLIKRHRPQYNARLKDDKSFPFLKVDIQNEWPTVTVTRRRTADGSRYFGPFSSAWSVRQTLQLIRKVFKFRACTGPLPNRVMRPCLNNDIGLCPGPCVGAITREDYRQTINRIVLFLEGRHKEVLNSLVSQMNSAAADLDFERAAHLRDQIHAVDLVTNRNAGVTALRGDQDILTVAQDSAVGLVEVFSVREGHALGRQDYPIENARESSPSEILRSFIVQYYRSASSIPPLILLQYPVADTRLISRWLSDLSGRKVKTLVPKSGIRRQLVDTVADSASRQLAGIRLAHTRATDAHEQALKELKETLELPSFPRRIEAYDISAIQGTSAVGSMVVFEDGISKPSEYRRFRIRSVQGQDDYAMMREVLRRRFARLEAFAEGGSKQSTPWNRIPSLIVVDGGRGQLGAALTARDESTRRRVPIIGLAKREEQVFVEGKASPTVLPDQSPALYLLQSVRDEAHRFAVSYHRTLRGSSALSSILDGIPGIGPSRRRALLVAFTSLDELRSASVEEIRAQAGVPEAIARAVKRHFAADGDESSHDLLQTSA